ncbi:LacI family transcriptional regulator [Oenococcus oeni]|uniref:LacI family transcriptional regulator n=1 Tax=Oenococcus oeni TaxID=1247 RepID=A0AAQ2URV4_OENOE|nr:LacI family DNA-binding transcriptional regulator [Oenococcus oeni]SYW01792.1 LacI family transcriptional regulator [Oenococcus oeni]SYW07520.1 LacI family transcriptional regulator [Oenococcus oeni]VDB98459.1 LacI family transcriptional regulator [Oenococcus oeni]
MKRANISDVAKEVGVSATTISRFLNGEFNKMSPSTKEEIENAIEKLNYRPFSSAREMRTDSTKTIGVIVGDTSNIFSSLLFTGIYDIFQPFEYSVLLLNANNSEKEEQRGINRLLSQRVDGLIIQPSQKKFKSYQNIIDSDTPLVMVDREVYEQPLKVNKVITNNFNSSSDMVLELDKKNYKRIILICNIKIISAQTPRIKGFDEIAKKKNIQVEILNVNNHTDEWFKNNLFQMIKKNNYKTVLVTLMGPLLFKALSFCKEFNLAFPEDIGILSFDDWDWSKFVHNGIDLIEQNPLEIGKKAGKNLYKYIHNDLENMKSVDVIPAKRVFGNSL